jgi:hypothetical protein
VVLPREHGTVLCSPLNKRTGVSNLIVSLD